MDPSAIPIIDHPVLRVEGGIVCAGDLHIGIETEYANKGVHIPSQTHVMEHELIDLGSCGKRLVLLGDIKHQVPGSSRQELTEIPGFLTRLADAFEGVDLVKGNHDGGIKKFLPGGVIIHPPTGFTLGDVGFAHGHTWPSKEVMSRRLLIVAHNHPAIMFKDGLGKVTTERCWLRCRFRDDAVTGYMELPEELIVIPALNRSIGGFPVNIEGGRLLGPLFSRNLVELETAGVYLVDGIHLGQLGDLMIQRSK